MTEYVEFSDFVTKGLTVDTADQRRIFKGHITAEIIDRQQEFIFVKEVMKIMEAFMEVNPVISDYHSNRMVGKVLSYEQSEYKGVATVLITGEVYKKDGITLYDKVWDKVVKGEYSGLSMGGASKEREPIQKDGKMALELRKLELYEIALCDTPANPFAVVESVNKFAKANGIERMVKEFNGREQIRCTSLGCKFEKFDVDQFMDKSDGSNINTDVDIDNHQFACDDDSNICKSCGKSEKEHGMEQFDKPKEVEKLTNQSLVNRSAETRAENVGEATGSPKETNDLINTIPKIPVKVKKDHIPSTPKDDDYLEEAQNKQDKINGKEITKDQPIGDINAKGEFPMKPRQKPNTMTDSNGNVNKFSQPSALAGAKKQSKVEGNMVHEVSERRVKDINKNDPCWEGYEAIGMKEQDGKKVPNCVKKAEENKPLNKPMRDGGDKKFKVYVKDPKTGNVVTVRFGDPNMEIKRDSDERRSSFRARHKCSEKKDITSAGYWSCKMWEKSSSVSDNMKKSYNWQVWLNDDSFTKYKPKNVIHPTVELILKLGIPAVKNALEEAETIQYLKTLHKKYQQ